MSHQIRIVGSDVCFGCEPGETILDAALKAGIEVPYSCRKGVCGNCAARVEGGDFERGPVSAEATPPGQELLCQCRPRADLAIAPSSWRRLEPGARKRLQLKVYRNTLAAPDVSLLQLRLPAGQRAKFRAGQYLQVQLPDGERRSYSMANPPHESDGVQLHVRHVAGGRFSALVADLQPGDLLDVELPFGQVDLDPEAGGPLLCVCGGTGFAPVKSLLDDLAKRKSARSVTLIWGARDRAGLYLLEHAAKWARALPNWRFVAALEDGAEAKALGAFHGRVDAAVRALASELPRGGEVYCCGAPPMVSAVRAACVDTMQLPAERFHADIFVPGPAG